MTRSLRLDALLGLTRSGLWFGQFLLSAVLLFVAGTTALSLLSWPAATRLVVTVGVGSLLVCFALVRVLVSLALVTSGGQSGRQRTRPTGTGLRLVEALLTLTAVGLSGLALLGTPSLGDLRTVLVAVGTPQFEGVVVVLATLVVGHAVGLTVFDAVSGRPNR